MTEFQLLLSREKLSSSWFQLLVEKPDVTTSAWESIVKPMT